MAFEGPRAHKGVLVDPTHDRTMTNWTRWRRKIAQSPACSRCNTERKDALHSVKDCAETKEVWTIFVSPNCEQIFFTLDLRQWLLRNLCAKSDALYGGIWPEAMAQICWQVWCWRCSDLFEGKRLSLAHRVELMQQSISETQTAFAIGPTHQGNWVLNNELNVM